MRSSFSNSLKAETASLGFTGTAVTLGPFRNSLPMESLISLLLVNIPGYHTFLMANENLAPCYSELSPIPKIGEQWDSLAQSSTFTGSIRQEFDITLVWKSKLFLLCFPEPPKPGLDSAQLRLCSHHSSSATLSSFPKKCGALLLFPSAPVCFHSSLWSFHQHSQNLPPSGASSC